MGMTGIDLTVYYILQQWVSVLLHYKENSRANLTGDNVSKEQENVLNDVFVAPSPAIAA